MSKFSICISFLCVAAICFAQDTPPKVPEADSQAIITAIEDEIYDYHLQEKFYEVGEPLTDNTWKIPVYFLPDPKGHDNYTLIYRLMPYGEMLRIATIWDSGLAGLYGNPNKGFPPHGLAMQTVYLNDDEICADKHKAAKFFFVVDMKPSKERIREAVARQKKRYGFSELERKASNKPNHEAETKRKP